MKNIDLVEVGIGSYGNLNVHSFENKKEKLIIGNYVSIADNVTFILGGNHQVNTFSTYPIKAKAIEPFSEDDAQTKGAIVVEDEVWIGTNVTILSGVTIGKGAIVAAGSVVTKNVAPFSVVGGNPARFIKNRIDERLISQRQEINLIDIDLDRVVKNIDLFYKELTEDVLREIEKLSK
ncbi:CatB-related O-acetyltransferase [Capnocytophaga canimorsus]|uniref:CatB-related O-acetyltransferase n=1 Tax=Capnocytophaga canimorsus TaxID=28188 RepID=UPI0038656266